MKLHPRRIRASLAHNGESIRSWAQRRGFGSKLKTIYALLNGARSGKKSPEVVRALEGIRRG